jgi:hypothetical protein
MPNDAIQRTIAIVQSNYLPWRGYFDLVRSVDEFILLDCVQYTRRDWRNRNLIKTSQGPRWITVPVEVKGKYFQAIDETYIADRDWAESHIRAIEGSYRRAAAFKEVSPWLFASLREVAQEARLSVVNGMLLAVIAEWLEIRTPIRPCTDLLDRDTLVAMQPSARLLALCQAAKADRYLSGPSARSYLDEPLFAAAGIEVAWMDYEGYPDYPQQWGPFAPAVSIIDLLLNTGQAAINFLSKRALWTSR